MRASFLAGPEVSQVKEIPLPDLKDDEVLMRVEACGVCSSEMIRWTGMSKVRYPTRLGHEPSGVIERVGKGVRDLEVGQPVAALAPGTGAFAEYVTIPREQVIPMAAGMEFTEAMAAEPLGCLLSGLQRTQIDLADRVAIVGCGFMGLTLLQLVTLRGPREIIAVDVRQEALNQPLRLGADRALLPESVEPEDRVTEWSHLGRGVDVVLETTGTQAGLTLAGEMTKAHGILSIVGWHADGLRTVDVGLWNWKAITVINAHERRMDHLVRCMEAGLQLITAGKLDVASLVTHTYPLADVDSAFADLRDKPPGFVKAVVLPQT